MSRAGRLALLVVILLAMLAAGACGPDTAGLLAPGGGDGFGAGNGAPPPAVTVTPTEFPADALDPLWEKEYARPVTAALSRDGQMLVVGMSEGSGSGERWGITVYNRVGERSWSRYFREARYRTIWVDWVDANDRPPVLAAAVFTYDNPGVLYAFLPDETGLWSRKVRSSVSLVPSPLGHSIYCIDRGNSLLHVLDLETGLSLWSRDVSPDALIQVGGVNSALLVEDGSLTLLDGRGGVLGRETMPEGAAGAVLAPDGQSVFVALSGPQSSVGAFDLEGERVWMTAIPCGGTNCLAVSPDGEYLLVYNVFAAGGFVLLRAEDGSVLCRNAFAPVEDARNQFIRWVRFLPDGQGFLADYAVVREGDSGYVEEHRLLLFDASGELRRAVDFGRNVDILAGDDGRTVVVVSTAVLGHPTHEKGKIRLYDLSLLLDPT